MKRHHRQQGLTLTIATRSPERSGWTVQIGGEAGAGLRLLSLFTLLALTACLTWFVDRSDRISPLLGRIVELESSLRQSQDQLALLQSRLGASNLGGSKLADSKLADTKLAELDHRLGAAEIAHREPEGASVDLSELRDTALAPREIEASVPSGWPVEGWISSGFGPRRSLISGRRLLHKGVDLVAPFGTPVLVGAPGKVFVAGWSAEGYGHHVIVDHANGYRTLYAHLSRLSVEAGATLERGDVVGLLGNTGYSTGPHLHYEVWVDGSPADPSRYLPSR